MKNRLKRRKFILGVGNGFIRSVKKQSIYRGIMDVFGEIAERINAFPTNAQSRLISIIYLILYVLGN